MNNIIRLLPKLLDAAGGNHELAESAAKVAWRRAAGDGLRLHAVPLRLVDNKLVVVVADAIWERQLREMGAELLARVNRVLGRDMIKFIEFRVDDKMADATNSSARVARSTAADSFPVELISAAGAIRDEELRRRFVRAAGNCIARREARADE